MDKMQHINQKIFILSLFTLALVLLPSFLRTAYACSTCEVYENALKQEFEVHKNWMDNEWWSQNLQPALKSSADEDRNVTLFETVIYGVFLDVQNLLSSLRGIQELSSDTLKNYTASDTICKFGTLSRSLALSESKAKTTQLVLSKRSINRQLGQAQTASAEGEDADRKARLKQFQLDYCDPKDFGGGMKIMCTGTPSDARQNIDINYTRAIDTKNSLDIDFTDSNSTNDEKDIIALANNLYAHSVFSRINAQSLKQNNETDTQSTYLNQRAIVAKRGIAENSFNQIVGQKSAGGTASKTYMIEVLKSLGLDATNAEKYLGTAPSYDAQMEVLTKKLYQDPAFYANLMDSPANVNRQYAALQSFGLMQKRDIFETVARSEILMSLLLEMEIATYQDNIQNRQN